MNFEEEHLIFTARESATNELSVLSLIQVFFWDILGRVLGHHMPSSCDNHIAPNHEDEFNRGRESPHHALMTGD